MGLFDRKNKKDNAEGNLEPPREGSVEVEFPIVTVVIEEVLSMSSTEVSAIGNVRGGTLKTGDRLYILGRRGKSKVSSAVRIEDTLMTKMPQAEEGTNVSIVLEGVRQGEVEKYDVLSSINCMASDLDIPEVPANPYLTGLLRESKNLQKEREFMGRLMEYIAHEAVLLTPCMHDPSAKEGQEKIGYALLKAKDGKMYLSAFTDAYEMESLNGLPEKALEPIDFDKIMMIMQQTPAAGLLINPAHEGFALKKEFLTALSDQKRKIVNNIREQRVDTKEPMGIALPKEEFIPHDLFDALSEYMKTEPSILRAWYGMMIWPKTNQKAHLIIIDTLEETPEIFGAIGRTARPFLEDTPLNMQTAAKVGNMTEKLMQFYERKDALKV